MKQLGKILLENKGKGVIVFDVIGAPHYISRYTKSKNSVLLEWFDVNGNFDSEDLYLDEPLPSNVKACLVTPIK